MGKRRIKRVAALGAAGVIGSAGIAAAAWLVNGTDTAEVYAGNTEVSLAVELQPISANLYPGSATIGYAEIVNPNNFRVTDIAFTPTVQASADVGEPCYAVTARVVPDTQAVIDAGASVRYAAYTLAMPADASEACQGVGAIVTLDVEASTV